MRDVNISGCRLKLISISDDKGTILTSRLRIIAANVGQRADNGQLSSAVLFVLLVEMTMASEKSFANLWIDSTFFGYLMCFHCLLSVVIQFVSSLYPLLGVEWKVTGIGHHVNGEICDLDECLSICVQQDGSVEQETAKFEERMKRQCRDVWL